MAKKKAVKKAVKKVAKKEAKQEVDKVACERELRKYVKRTGGLRKDITDVDKMRALHLMELLERKETVWDKSIIPISSEKRKLI